MRRLTKFFLMGGLFLCMMGGLMALSGWLLGADTHALDDRVETVLGKSVSQWAMETSGWNKTVRSVDLEAFDSIQVDLDLGDVSVYSGEDFGISLIYWGTNYQVLHQLQDGKLHIWSESGGHIPSNVGAQVEIYLPEGAVLEGGTLDLALGDLDWQEVAMTGKLTCELGMGDASVSGALTGGIEIDSGMGDISLYGPLTGEVALSSGMGDMDVTVTDMEQSAYRYELSTGMGDIYLDGEEQSDNSLKEGKGANRITLSTGMGDVSLAFDQ